MAEPDRLRHQSENPLHRTGRPHMAMRNRADQALADRTAPIKPRHLRGEASLIEKHQAIRVDPGLHSPPGLTPLLHVRTILFCGVRGLFLNGCGGARGRYEGSSC